MVGPMTVARRRRWRLLLALGAMGLLGWLVVTWDPPRPLPRVVDAVQVMDNSRAGVLLLGWEADRCERLTASSTATVERSRLVLDLAAVEDANCMAQEPVGSTDPVRRWRMLEAIVVNGDLDDLGADRSTIQLACERPGVTGCGTPVPWEY